MPISLNQLLWMVILPWDSMWSVVFGMTFIFVISPKTNHPEVKNVLSCTMGKTIFRYWYEDECHGCAGLLQDSFSSRILLSRFETVYTGLADCQNRDLDRLRFHFNVALIRVDLAKSKALEKGVVLSMASVKVLCHNLFIMQWFISILGIKPDEEINRKLWEEGIKFAAIAA